MATTKDTTKRKLNKRSRKAPGAETPVYEREFKNYREELIAFKVDDRDLDVIAHYFGGIFECDTEPMAVLVEVLQRIVNVSKARAHGGSVHIEDVVHSLSERLFIQCMAGEISSRKFAASASAKAEKVLAPFRAAS
jgi:hypothetical protein